MAHEALFARIEPMVVLVVAMILLILLGAMATDSTDDAQALYIGGVVAGVAGISLLPFLISRRRWEITDSGLSVRSSPWFLPRALHRRGQLPWQAITRVDRMWLGAREAVRVAGPEGSATIILGGDTAMVAQIRQRAGGLPLTEAAGFWAGPFGLVLLATATVGACFIAYAAGLTMFDDEVATSSARKGVGAALVLPFVCGYGLVMALRRAWRVFRSNRRAAR